jgi:hypothetical protein
MTISKGYLGWLWILMNKLIYLFQAPPASAKTMFLESLSKLKSSYFVDGVSATKSGLIDCLFLHNPKYLLIDEIDKISAKDNQHHYFPNC